MGLFTDIYNTVAKFFRSQDEHTIEDPSKSVAQNRLKLVLMQDRTNLTPKVLEQMRGEMIDLLSKYLEMDKDLLELNFEQEGNQVALMLSIPVIRAKDEEEIEAAIKASEGVNEEVNEGVNEGVNEEGVNNEEEEGDDYVAEEDSETESEPKSETEVEAVDGVSKPKKKRTKKVSAPEELGKAEENDGESRSEEDSENTEFEAVCEHFEG